VPGTPDDRPGRVEHDRAPARFRGRTAPWWRGRFVGFLVVLAVRRPRRAWEPV